MTSTPHGTVGTDTLRERWSSALISRAGSAGSRKVANQASGMGFPFGRCVDRAEV